MAEVAASNHDFLSGWKGCSEGGVKFGYLDCSGQGLYCESVPGLVSYQAEYAGGFRIGALLHGDHEPYPFMGEYVLRRNHGHSGSLLAVLAALLAVSNRAIVLLSSRIRDGFSIVPPDFT